jgi:hypothetical protein
MMYRKGFHAFNVVCVTDMMGRIRAFTAADGSEHDAKVYKNHLNYIALPDGKFFLGDGAFAASKRMLKPHRLGEILIRLFGTENLPKNDQELYNRVFTGLRIRIERVFGQLKKLFKYFKYPKTSQRKTRVMISALFCLYNYIKEEDGELSYGARADHLDVVDKYTVLSEAERLAGVSQAAASSQAVAISQAAEQNGGANGAGEQPGDRVPGGMIEHHDDHGREDLESSGVRKTLDSYDVGDYAPVRRVRGIVQEHLEVEYEDEDVDSDDDYENDHDGNSSSDEEGGDEDDEDNERSDEDNEGGNYDVNAVNVVLDDNSSAYEGEDEDDDEDEDDIDHMVEEPPYLDLNISMDIRRSYYRLFSDDVVSRAQGEVMRDRIQSSLADVYRGICHRRRHPHYDDMDPPE